MKKTTKPKAIVLSLMMVAMMLPMTSFAQKNDSFITPENFDNRDFSITWAITNNSFGAPLGSGLLILTAVGAGYAVAKRRRNFKKGTTLFLAVLMLLGMTNCRKKTVEPMALNSNGNTYYINLNVDGGAKVNVTPGETSATVEFQENDTIYVSYKGAFVGKLIHDGTAFSGTVTTTIAGEYPLYFYFFGNKAPKISGTQYTVNIYDQTASLPVISSAASHESFKGDGTYTAELDNKCALVKFNTTNINKAVTITGMKNEVTVDFSTNGYTYTKSGTGEIRLHAKSSTERWAILLPQDEVTTATAYASGYTTTSAFTVPAVDVNNYNNTGVDVALTAGSTKGAFTINTSGDQVFFSQGNLQAVFASANTSTCTWQFAANQWDFIGNATANTAVDDNVVTTAGTVDLFGWVGASSSLAAYGINKDKTTGGYGNSDSEALKEDWGSTMGSGWRTLTNEEWGYLFNTRTTTSGVRFAKATVNSVSGVILLPDDWSTSYYSLNSTNGGSYSSNTINSTNWTNNLEAHGAVFLPAAGERSSYNVSEYGTKGRYWSSTPYNASQAYYVTFTSNAVTPQNTESRFRGCSVRLVRDL